MDINYELYKVFYYVASTLSFSEASKQLFISQSLSASPSSTGEEAGSDLIHPEYQESPSYYRRRDPSAPHRTGDQPDQARRKPAPRCRRTRRTASYRSQ